MKVTAYCSEYCCKFSDNGLVYNKITCIVLLGTFIPIICTKKKKSPFLSVLNNLQNCHEILYSEVLIEYVSTFKL